MPKLPPTKARDVIKVVEKRGSHAVYIHSDGRRTTIPIHPTQTIGIGLLTKIIRKDIQINRNKFIQILKK